MIGTPGLPPDFQPVVLSYEVVAQYPHDNGAFTEGLILDSADCVPGDPCNRVTWESTGKVLLQFLSSAAANICGQSLKLRSAEAPSTAGSQFYPSSIRQTNLATGKILEEQLLPSQEWGEGLTLLNDTCACLTSCRQHRQLVSVRP